MKNLELLILRGLPASGKTTFARDWVNEDPKNRVRVNRDDIRRMLGPYWVPSREKLVTSIENQSISSALDKGYSVVSDSTNFRWDEEKTRWYAKFYSCNVKIKDFNTSVEECIRRDKLREHTVGEEVIIRMAKKYMNYGL